MVRKFEVRSIVSVVVEQVLFLKGLDVYFVTFVSGRLAGYDDGAAANVEGLINTRGVACFSRAQQGFAENKNMTATCGSLNRTLW